MEQKLTREMIFGSYKNKKQNEEVFNDEKNNSIKIVCYTSLSPDCLVDFRQQHPFNKLDENKFEETKESIKSKGILEDIIVRKINEEKYEIIAGHNRVRIARELNLENVPAKVVEVNDDEANIIMVDTNLCKRENVSPIEKGYAYKIKLEAMKNLKLDNGVPGGHQKSIEELAENSNEGVTTIKRYIRLTELIKSLQDKVALGEQISVKVGVELSYLNIDEQKIVNDYLEENKNKISVAQAENIRAVKGTITKEIIDEIINPTSKELKQKFTGKVDKIVYKKYKDKFKNDDEFNSLIDELLAKYFGIYV